MRAVRDTLGIITGLAGVVMVVVGAFRIHEGLGIIVLGMMTVGLARAILE
jgi:hypothetical protein